MYYKPPPPHGPLGLWGGFFIPFSKQVVILTYDKKVLDWIYINGRMEQSKKICVFLFIQKNKSISSQHQTKYNSNRLEMTIAHLRNDL